MFENVFKRFELFYLETEMIEPSSAFTSGVFSIRARFIYPSEIALTCYVPSLCLRASWIAARKQVGALAISLIETIRQVLEHYNTHLACAHSKATNRHRLARSLDQCAGRIKSVNARSSER